MELNEARQLALDLAPRKGVERVNLAEALGRALAEEIFVERNIPEESRSRLDGFALRSIDSSQAAPDRPVELKLLPNLLAAGHMVEQEIDAGECIRILTGAPIPANADAVVAQENVIAHKDHITLKRPLTRGKGILFSGEDLRKGELLLPRGEILTPTRLALIATMGEPVIPVYEKPIVALLATGDEVRELGEPIKGPWTYCNNRHLLAWLTLIHGGKPVHLGVARDNPEAIAERIHNVEADFVITTGGIGRGDKDFILEAWDSIGVRKLFRHINISPGKNSALGIGGERLFWGLPGNPWGAQLVFQELVAPALLISQGLEPMKMPLVSATLASPLSNPSSMFKAVRGSLNCRVEPAVFFPPMDDGGSFLSTIKDSFAYIILEPHVIEMSAGSRVQARLHDFPMLASPLL